MKSPSPLALVTNNGGSIGAALLFDDSLARDDGVWVNVATWQFAKNLANGGTTLLPVWTTTKSRGDPCKYSTHFSEKYQ
ncbi:MAG: hypothetical protein KDH08_15170 [Anaerolineae bacterium]|nr:hypothetical protein [Anaerolineae bacterium]MCB0239946.1 hypothetical protein [Anaerolineae bacterium]